MGARTRAKPAFDKANTNPPQWLAEYPALTAADISFLDTRFNLRVEAVRAVDDMIAALMTTLKNTGLDKSTYLVFSSDNGYHIGEHMLLAGQSVTDWRHVALVEHHGPDLEPRAPDDPDNEDAGRIPNSYEAIRTATSLYVEYQDAEKEYYDLTTDPYEMTNTAGSLSATQLQSLHATLAAIEACHGAADCWTAQKLQP